MSSLRDPTIVLAVSLVACASSSQAPTTAPDAYIPPVVRDGSADAPSAATCPLSDFSSSATCNTVVNNATAVAFAPGTGTAPTFTGGTIRDGVYHATKTEAWGTSTGTGLDAQGSVATTMVAITSATTSGNQLTQTTVCITGSAQIPTIESYTATSTELILSVTQGSVIAVTTYARAGCP